MSKAGEKAKVRVLVVDDSAVVRSLLTKVLNSDPGIEVVATAADPYIARDKLIAFTPDVMTLDIEMPKMDGLTFLGKVMQHMPTRTIIISALTTERSELALRALELGALDVVAKPKLDLQQSLGELGQTLIDAVKTAASAKLAAVKAPALGSEAPAARPLPRKAAAAGRATQQILAIASSTGGTEALKVLLRGLPADIPGTVIVQHMPPVFTKAYAATLNRMLPFEVREAVDGDQVLRGLVLLAPGDFHMEVERRGAQYYVRLHQQPPLHGVRPAADHLLNSVAKIAPSQALGVVLTGMGRDGAAGLLSMRAAGSYNIAQDEASCVVFGMPKAAIEAGAIHEVMDPVRIAKALTHRFTK